MTHLYRWSQGLGLIGLVLLSGVPRAASITTVNASAIGPTGPTPQFTQLPSNLGHPTRGTRRGGGSRGGSCELAEGESPLTALMPADPNADPESLVPESVVSMTYQDAPDLWFYMPYRLDHNSQVDFVVKNVDGDTLYETRLNTESLAEMEPGIIQVSWANLAAALTPETGYHWYLTVHCNVGSTVTVDGWLYQSEILPLGQVTSTTAESITVLAEHQASQGFWVDSLSTIQRGLQDDPNSELLQTTWQSLLAAEGLADIAEQPIQYCCEFELVP